MYKRLAVQTDTLYREPPRGTFFVRKLNLGTNMPLPLTQSSNTNTRTSYLLLQLYRYTKSECYIFIRNKKMLLSLKLIGTKRQLVFCIKVIC